ncbi:MAG: response regulator, partial [Beijerinckiaceae bacterium]
MSQQQHVLIVDDDAGVRAVLRDCLEMEGFSVSEASDGAAMRSLLKSRRVDLMTLDLMLGGESGLSLARDVRATQDVPIVMISGKGDTIDRVVGLELGADDYIAKPFHPREVVARIRAVLRRKSPAVSVEGEFGARLSFGGLTLDLGRRELTGADGCPIMITTAEFNLLELLARRPHRVLSRDAIMDLLKGHDWTPMDRSIDALVSRLRRKIENDPATPSLIKTVRGVGYVLTTDVIVKD